MFGAIRTPTTPSSSFNCASSSNCAQRINVIRHPCPVWFDITGVDLNPNRAPRRSPTPPELQRRSPPALLPYSPIANMDARLRRPSFPCPLQEDEAFPGFSSLTQPFNANILHLSTTTLSSHGEARHLHSTCDDVQEPHPKSSQRGGACTQDFFHGGLAIG